MLFLRTTERPRGDSETVRGVRVARWSRVIGASGQPEAVQDGPKWLFPGSSPDVAMVLVRANLGPDVLDAPDVSVEFGERPPGGTWLCERLIKAHRLSAGP